jgi:hypothetical protein
VVLINPYELGRQPFALAEPAALLKRAGFAVDCLDLSLQTLDPEILAEARLVAIYVGMHTATRIAIEAIPRIRLLCAAGRSVRLRPLRADERGFAAFARRGNGTRRRDRAGARIFVSAIARKRFGVAQSRAGHKHGEGAFVVPDRSGLPNLSRYARLVLADGSERVAGFAEGSRGCKHLCRHCPVVPVYEGRFRVVAVDVVSRDSVSRWRKARPTSRSATRIFSMARRTR